MCPPQFLYRAVGVPRIGLAGRVAYEKITLSVGGLFCLTVLEDFADLLGHALGGFAGLEVVSGIITVIVNNVPYFGLVIYSQFATYKLVILTAQFSPPCQTL